jgi:DNA-binding NtrC family response regulator
MHREQDGRHTILIVDDGKDFRKALRDFLTDLGHRIREASSGKKALDLLRKSHDIDLVLLDIHMPGLNGLEALSELKKIASDLSVILLTGYSAQDIAASIPKGYAQDCIEKTMAPEEMGRRIKRVLGNRKNENNTSEWWTACCSR